MRVGCGAADVKLSTYLNYGVSRHSLHEYKIGQIIK